MKKEITCYILLDGFKVDYIKNTNFIRRTKKNYVSKVEESFGFQSFRPAVFAGISPEKSNICHIWFYSPYTSPYRKFKLPLRVINMIKLNLFVSKIIAVFFIILAKLSKKNYLKLYNPVEIPINLLSYFDISEKKIVTEGGYVHYQTLFDILQKHKNKFIYLGYPVTGFSIKDKNIRIDDIINDKNLDFIFLHMNISDIFSHKYGPNSKELKNLHKYEDEFVEKVYNFLKSNYKIVNLIIGSDHGMVEVKNHINIWEKLQNLSVKLEKDYIVFLDSPMARFWFFNERAEKEIKRMLNKFKCGRILTKKDKGRYRIRFKDNRYMDLIWLANPGILIFPNFFQWHKPCKGMHGYASEVEDNKGVFMIISNKNLKFKKRKNLKMVDVFPTLYDIMNLPIPKTCEGRGIIKK